MYCNSIREAQDRLLSRRFGVFNHYLYGNPSDGVQELGSINAYDWDERVAAFDVDGLARRLHECGAGYYCITIMQGSKHMLAPNSTYDELAGTRPGEACPRRDLIADIASALAKFDIDLYLYYTGDGPHNDAVIGPRFGYGEPRGQVTMDFVQRWSAVLREYALRYGESVKGWWIDGCYRQFFGYNDELMQPYYDACIAGNPFALVAMNDGVKPGFEKNFRDESMVCGEFNDFTELPPTRFIDGAQAHILAPLGKGRNESEWSRWRSMGARRSPQYMSEYIRRANAAGMPVTIDVYIDGAGGWDEEQRLLLNYVGKNI